MRYQVELISGHRRNGDYSYEIMDTAAYPPRVVATARRPDADRIATLLNAAEPAVETQRSAA